MAEYFEDHSIIGLIRKINNRWTSVTRPAFSKLRCNHCDKELLTVESLKEHIIGEHGTPYQSICEVSIKEVT